MVEFGGSQAGDFGKEVTVISEVETLSAVCAADLCKDDQRA